MHLLNDKDKKRGASVNNIVLFDGECNFCNNSVQFIIKRDRKAQFKFASIQSDVGEEIVRTFNVPANINSLILVEGNKCYFKSSAALRICKNLKGVWKLFYCLLIIPKSVRDYFYDIIAKNRYKWFGKKDRCMVPSPEIQNRFLK
jgi:predicted DCC family thiol-disulfide oxidoreductase YuxK